MTKRDATTNKQPTSPDQEEKTPSQSTVYNIRLPREELANLEVEASKEGLSVAEYLRQAAAMRPAKTILTKPQFNLSVSTPYAQYGTLVTWSESQTITDVKITAKGLSTPHYE